MRVEDFPCVHDLPRAFLKAEGTARQRVHDLVNRCWAPCPAKQRRELTQALLALLQPLLDEPNRLSHETIQKLCEVVVEEWLARARVPGQRGQRRGPAVA